LLVDDNADSVEVREATFRACGAGTVAAQNVPTALSYLDTGWFDVIVSELALPGRDGVDLIRALRKRRGSGRAMPAIALTGYREQYDDVTLDAGFDAYLRKPVDLDALCLKVRALVDEQRR
jgi:CheY-like chemotaxis protein